jgi:hypothetical protein
MNLVFCAKETKRVWPIARKTLAKPAALRGLAYEIWNKNKKDPSCDGSFLFWQVAPI